MGALAQKFDVSSAAPGFWERCVRPLDAGQSSPDWHVSPAIDIAAYHFSWAWVLLPMFFATQETTVYYIYAFVMGANLAHRHFGLPYAYLDRDVFNRFERQLTWFPQFCILMLAATPLLLTRSGTIGATAVGAVVFLSLLWNFWHVYMQKFGILRLYQAKSPALTHQGTPAWIDKYFILCWIPLYLSYLVPKYKDLIFANGPDVKGPLSVIVSFMERNERWLIAPTAAIAAAGVGLWLWHEWRARRFQNRPRMSAAAGMLALSTSLFWANPVEAYIAFGFSHAVEYMVFVWAFQRRRYARPHPQPSTMERLLRHPRTWYVSFIAVFGALGILEGSWGSLIMKGSHPVQWFGMTAGKWLFYYAVYESLVHFYMDGFLWKMRRADVRENI
jgi:hypothetical protein